MGMERAMESLVKNNGVVKNSSDDIAILNQFYNLHQLKSI